MIAPPIYDRKPYTVSCHSWRVDHYSVGTSFDVPPPSQKFLKDQANSLTNPAVQGNGRDTGVADRERSWNEGFAVGGSDCSKQW